jgi:hypothetical protein
MPFFSFAGSNQGFDQPSVPGTVPGPFAHGGIPGFVPPFHGRFPPAPPTPPAVSQGLTFVPLALAMVPMAPTVIPGLVSAVVPAVVPAVSPIAPVVVPAAVPVITPAVAPPITSVAGPSGASQAQFFNPFLPTLTEKFCDQRTPS